VRCLAYYCAREFAPFIKEFVHLIDQGLDGRNRLASGVDHTIWLEENLMRSFPFPILLEAMQVNEVIAKLTGLLDLVDSRLFARKLRENDLQAEVELIEEGHAIFVDAANKIPPSFVAWTELQIRGYIGLRVASPLMRNFQCVCYARIGRYHGRYQGGTA
jgi:hypothetical protein